MVDGTASSRPSAMPRMVLRRILPELVLGRRGDHVHSPQRGDRPDLIPDELDELGGQDVRIGADPGLEHHEPARDLALK